MRQTSEPSAGTTSAAAASLTDKFDHSPAEDVAMKTENQNRRRRVFPHRVLANLSCVFPSVFLCTIVPGLVFGQGFRVEESTIAETQRAIKAGEVTCKGVVQAYLDRVKAYNGTCTALVTKDGKPIPSAKGLVRAGMPLTFPTKTVAAATVLPDFDQYKGLPLEFGRMESTLSDPSVQQQFGMRVGIPNAGQLNALETLNIRGERSVTCKAKCDAHPSTGALPATCPKECDAFRKQPDALEHAAELDKKYGRNPDLEKMPMYCVTFAWKNWYDATDMRATGGNDVNFAMDAPKLDSPDVADLRAKGAISFAIANAARAGAGDDGPAKAKSVFIGNNLAYGAWGGQPCNPYDTERVPRGSSSGSGVSIAANLASCSVCEQTGGSCKGPASRNNIVNLLTTKGILMDGGYGYQAIGDRAGVFCRTVEDAVRVLDAAKGFDSRDMYSALPKGSIPKEPYTSFLVKDAGAKPLKGMRIAVAREFMVKHTKNDEAISDQLDKEIKAVLRDKLGAELVESSDPKYPDDPSIPNLKYTFQDAIAEILAHNVPEYFWQKTPTGELEFAVPGWDVTSIDYAVALALGKAPLSEKLTLRRLFKQAVQSEGGFAWNKYLGERGDARVKDWASWVANAKFDNERARVAAENTAKLQDARQKPGTISYLKMQTVLRLVVLKVMRENGIDAFVNPENTLPHFKLGGPSEPVVDNRDPTGYGMAFTAMMGGPEIEVPAGYTQVVYEPQYVLSADKTKYEEMTGTVASKLPNPMPLSMAFWGGPGDEPALIKTASAYEAATHHRKPPPSFGSVQAASKGQ
jgi:Asp-tRNA(Asn)/Glu-tRNA(Gln) amidotransferase A subunit family amidase